MSDSSPLSEAALSALVARLRTTNAGLREVIAGQAVQIETQAAQIGVAHCAGCGVGTAAEQRLGDLEPAAVVGSAVSQACSAFLAELVGT